MPPDLTEGNICSLVIFNPIASKAKSTPPLVSFIISSTGSTLDEFIVLVAPNSLANLSFISSMSTTIIGSAFKIDAVFIAVSYTHLRAHET